MARFNQLLLKHSVIILSLFLIPLDSIVFSMEEKKKSEYMTKREREVLEAEEKAKKEKGNETERRLKAPKVTQKELKLKETPKVEENKNIEEINIDKFNERKHYLTISSLLEEEGTRLNRFFGLDPSVPIPTAEMRESILKKKNNMYIITNAADREQFVGFLMLQYKKDIPSEIIRFIQAREEFKNINITKIASLSVLIFKEYSNQGLASKACKLIIEKFKKDKTLSLIIWDTLSNNQSSINTAQRCGFQEVDDIPFEDRRLFVQDLKN